MSLGCSATNCASSCRRSCAGAEERSAWSSVGLLSVGLLERAILADRTPPTDDPTPIETANGPKGIYGRRSLSKPPKPTILDLSHRPHYKRLPRQRFSATGVTEYWIATAASVRLDVGRLDHFAPLLRILDDVLAELG